MRNIEYNLRMKIGILSDTHNNIENLQKALAIFAQHDIEILVHCGDVNTPDTAAYLKGFQIHYVYGNTDHAQMHIGSVIHELNPQNSAGLTFTGEVDGVLLAATHGHVVTELDRLINDGRYQYVFYGHTHQRQDEMMGTTRVINPGALGGTQYEPRSICILDLQTDELMFLEII